MPNVSRAPSVKCLVLVQGFANQPGWQWLCFLIIAAFRYCCVFFDSFKIDWLGTACIC